MSSTNALPPIHTFAPLDGMSLAELSAEFDYALAKERQFQEGANNPQFYRAEFQSAHTDWSRANARACANRQVACVVAYRALRAAAIAEAA